LPPLRIIGCLFHFKQALYREAQQQGLAKNELKEETKNLISLLGSLSWIGNMDNVEKELQVIENKYKQTKHNILV